MKLVFKKRFSKSYQRFPLKTQNKVNHTISLFLDNPFDASLRNHGLQGALWGCRSLDVTSDIRIIFKEMSDGTYELVELLDVGTHSQLYG